TARGSDRHFIKWNPEQAPGWNLTNRRSRLWSRMNTKLQQLRNMTTVVADTGDIEAIRRHRPEDATTNPSLLLKAAELPDYAPLLAQAREFSQRQGGGDQARRHNLCDHLAVSIGSEILNVVPGLVSTEVDARLSFDTRATLERARRL